MSNVRSSKDNVIHINLRMIVLHRATSYAPPHNQRKLAGRQLSKMMMQPEKGREQVLLPVLVATGWHWAV